MNTKYFVLLSLFVYSMNNAASTNAQKSTGESKNLGEIIYGQASQWITQNIQQLSNEEVSLLANLLYYDYVCSVDETSLRANLINLRIHESSLNTCITTNDPRTREITLQCAVWLHNLKELLPVRANKMKAWQMCLAEIEKSKHPKLTKMVSDLQSYGRMLITQVIKRDQATIEKTVKNSYSIIDTNLKQVLAYNNTYQAILDHKNPFLKEGFDEDVANIDSSLALADKALDALKQIEAGLYDIKRMSIDLLNINTLMFGIFYRTLYAHLMQTNKLPIYLMFDENGMIAPAERIEFLPSLAPVNTPDQKNNTKQ